MFSTPDLFVTTFVGSYLRKTHQCNLIAIKRQLGLHEIVCCKKRDQPATIINITDLS